MTSKAAHVGNALKRSVEEAPMYDLWEEVKEYFEEEGLGPEFGRLTFADFEEWLWKARFPGGGDAVAGDIAWGAGMDDRQAMDEGSEDTY